MTARRLLRSPLFGDLRHGFSTRVGGVSEGRFASLNLGRSWGDEPGRVAENRRLLAEDGGFEPERLTTARQVHRADVVRADGRPPEALALVEADGLWSAEPGQAIAVLTADCVPILLADDAGRVAAVHAGWRGTVQRIAGVAVEALVAGGARRDRIRAALGPSIGPCCFEVGEEVAEAFAAVVPGAVVRDGRPRPHVDLWTANAALLVAAGVSAGRLDARPPCTHCDAARFYSFRRDGAGIGQMLSFVVPGIVPG